jgi:cation diffusion facilitator family transporter
MAHNLKLVRAAVALNSLIFIGEAIAGTQAHSLSLLMDSVHNLSDVIALIAIWLAFVLAQNVSRTLLRSANLFNAVGLLVMSVVLLVQAVERLIHPAPVSGTVPIVVGLAAAGGNWGVARLLKSPAKNNAAIRLAYMHNMGDAYISLFPAGAGLLTAISGSSLFDPLMAGGIGIWIIWSTIRQVLGSGEELVWPENIACGHADDTAATAKKTPSGK